MHACPCLVEGVHAHSAVCACSVKGTSSGEHSSSCDPAQQLVSAHVSDPEADPLSPTVPGASVLSGSSLDIGKIAGPFPDVPLATEGSSTIDGSTARTDRTDAAPSTEVSGTSVICAGGAVEPSTPHLASTPPASSPHGQPLTAEEHAHRCLLECRQDVEDEHLDVEGVVQHGPRGPVFWGSWRGLEVAINPFKFRVRAL